ncbi:MAG: VWA containing CoxE family protein [Clostridiales bacterium]|nr:VWA containing CoxE family protein [Clostridiales bacterium]
MFSSFFYLLRAKGLTVSLNEWMTLIEALDQGLCSCSFSDFYYLCRMILVKSESDFDTFDIAFLEFFKDMEHYAQIPKDLMEWLNDPQKLAQFREKNKSDRYSDMSYEEIMRLLEERIQEQKERHDGGSYWVGTGGQSPFGNNGYTSNGIRVGGKTGMRTALTVAGDRKYKDFRNDNSLDDRQFQMAFRRLRQFSSKDSGPKTEFNVQASIDKTCENGGNLELVFDRPRINTVKVLLFMDSGGSMYYYSKISSMLFQAVSKSRHFKDIKVYYFHNCIYDRLYTDPSCIYRNSTPTEWVLKNISSDYKLIFIGDAAMAPHELLGHGYYTYRSGENNISTGLDYLHRFKKKYRKNVWLNPSPEREWYDDYWGQTVRMIMKEIPMYHLSVQGLEAAMKHLLVTK